MAAQVLAGSGPVSYTNSTGQNVRLVINYLRKEQSGGPMYMNFPGTTIKIDSSGSGDMPVYGKYLAYQHRGGENQLIGQNAYMPSSLDAEAIPLEIALANGDTFSLSGYTPAAVGSYNIIIIPEAG